MPSAAGLPFMTQPTSQPTSIGHRWGKGHPYYPPKNPDRGKRAETRKKMRELAVIIREEWPPEQMFAWLRAVASGKDPDAAMETMPDGTQVAAGGVPPDWSVRMRAVKMLLERALGLPAQHVQIDAEVRAALGVASVTADASSFKNMNMEALKSLRGGLRELVRAAAARPANADDDEDD